MSLLGARTKKVTTYGKKKTQVITVHSDFSPERKRQSLENQLNSRPSALTTTTKPTLLSSSRNVVIETGTPCKRPPLQSKISNNDLATTPNLLASDDERVGREKKGFGGGDKLKVPLNGQATQMKPISATASTTFTAKTSFSSVEKSRPRPHIQIRVSRFHAPRASLSSTDSEPIIRVKRAIRPGKIAIPSSPISTDNTPIKASPSSSLNLSVSPPFVPSLPKSSRTARQAVHVVIPTTRPQQVFKNSKAAITAVYDDESDDETSLTLNLSQVSISSSEKHYARLLNLTPHPTAALPFESFFTSPFLRRLMPGRQVPVMKKLGEASYSEVFGLKVGDDFEAVAKIVPLLGDESVAVGKNGRVAECSEVVDVLREIEITEKMSRIPGSGFVKFLGAFVVEGLYPSDLLDLWDDFKSECGSASARPDCFTSKQRYVIMLLSNGGVDLESFHFDPNFGWIQAAGVFWQTACSLARAESWASFEHRDLHEGQILIRPQPDGPSPDADPQDLSSPLASGVSTTIIDFGLSRLDLDNGRSTGVALPIEVYQGVGEQWDVYRAMRNKINDDWTRFHPITNVLWLQYTLRRILKDTPSLTKPKPHRTGRKPTTQRGLDKAVLRDRSGTAFESLLLIEERLNQMISGGGDRDDKSRRRRGRGEVSANELVAWGKEMNWVV